jgi:hypothetical protein
MRAADFERRLKQQAEGKAGDCPISIEEFYRHELENAAALPWRNVTQGAASKESIWLADYLLKGWAVRSACCGRTLEDALIRHTAHVRKCLARRTTNRHPGESRDPA